VQQAKEAGALADAEQRLDVAGIEAVEPLGVPRRLDAICQQQLGETAAKKPAIEKRVLHSDDQMSIFIAGSGPAPRPYPSSAPDGNADCLPSTFQNPQTASAMMMAPAIGPCHAYQRDMSSVQGADTATLTT